MELAKIQDNGMVDVVFCSPLNGSRLTELRESGFLDFVASEQPQVKSGQIAVDSCKIIDGKVVQSWEIKTDLDGRMVDGFEKAEDWTNYLKDYAEKVRNPLVVTIQK